MNFQLRLLLAMSFVCDKLSANKVDVLANFEVFNNNFSFGVTCMSRTTFLGHVRHPGPCSWCHAPGKTSSCTRKPMFVIRIPPSTRPRPDHGTRTRIVPMSRPPATLTFGNNGKCCSCTAGTVTKSLSRTRPLEAVDFSRWPNCGRARRKKKSDRPHDTQTPAPMYTIDVAARCGDPRSSRQEHTHTGSVPTLSNSRTKPTGRRRPRASTCVRGCVSWWSAKRPSFSSRYVTTLSAVSFAQDHLAFPADCGVNTLTARIGLSPSICCVGPGWLLIMQDPLLEWQRVPHADEIRNSSPPVKLM
jgi:hypothetical protein